MRLNVIVICFFSGLADEEIIGALEESDEEGFDDEVDDPTFQISSDNEAPVKSSGGEENGEEGDEQRDVEVAQNVDEPMPGTSHDTRRPRRTAKPMTKWKANCSVSRLALQRAAMPNIFLSFLHFFISLLSVA